MTELFDFIFIEFVISSLVVDLKIVSNSFNDYLRELFVQSFLRLSNNLIYR